MSEHHEIENDHPCESEANWQPAAETGESVSSHCDDQHHVDPPQTEEGTHDAEGRSRSAEVLDLIAGVENQLERMRTAQSACVDEIESLEQRRESIQTRENEITRLSSDLDNRRSEFEHRMSEIENREHEISEKMSHVEQCNNEIAAREQALNERSEQIHSNESEINSIREQLDTERNELSHTRGELEQERASFANERAGLEAELASIRNRSEETENRYAEIERERTTLTERIEEMSGALTEMGTRASASEETIKSLEQEMLGLTGKLEEAAVGIERRDAELQQTRTASETWENERKTLQEKLLQRDAEFEELQVSLGHATDRLQSLANAVAEQAPKLEEGATAVALCRQQEQRLRSLTEELEAARRENTQLEHMGDADGALASAREELERMRMELEDSLPVDEHQRVVASLEIQLANATESMGTTESADPALRAELDQARSELAAMTTHAEGCETALRDAEEKCSALQQDNERLERDFEDQTGDESEDAQRLREQAHRLSDFAVHLQRRRARLSSMRTALRSRSQFTTTSSSVDSIDDDRRTKAADEDLLRRRHELTDMESRMIRRWASQGSVGIVFRVALLVLLVGAASWFGVRWLAPGTVSASALVRAQPVAGGTMDDERGVAWNEWHKTIVADKLFADAVASRLAATPAGFDGGSPAVQSAINEKVTIDTIQPGMLKISFDGSSRSESMRMLEGIVSTLAAESQRQLPRRGDGARVDVQSRDGRIAGLDPIPVTAHQVQTAGLVFGGSLAGLAILGAAVYSRLSRSRRLFDENAGLEEGEIL